MPRKFAYQIAARYSRRHAQALLRGGLLQGQRDAKQVRVRVFDRDAVCDHFFPVLASFPLPR